MSHTNLRPWQMLDADLHLETLDHAYAPGVLNMIAPDPKRILDVGCFCGGTGRWLKNRFPGCEVIGIEKVEKAAAEASQIYDRVIVGAFEKIDFAGEGLAPNSFDTIVAADVLEHLYNPWKALQRLKPLLSSGGAIYISLPNIRNLIVLSELASGSWQYAGAGLLDITHIRFFTQAQALEMLRETGWTITEIRMHPDPRLSGAFEGRSLEEIMTVKLGSVTIDGLTPIDIIELKTLQFFIRAQPE